MENIVKKSLNKFFTKSQ